MEPGVTDKQNDLHILARAAAVDVVLDIPDKEEQWFLGSLGRFPDLLFARLLVSKFISFILILTTA